MIRVVRHAGGECVVVTPPDALADVGDAAWIDLRDPTQEEERAVERMVGTPVPTREEMAEIEVSSRLYHEGDAAVMITPVLINSTGPFPRTTDVTFVLTQRHLVTVRYDEPTAFATFGTSARRTPDVCARPDSAFVGLLDAIVDRLADILEETGRELDSLGRGVFTGESASHDMRGRMQALGRLGEIVSKARESLVGLARLCAFAQGLEAMAKTTEAGRKLRTVAHDVDTLTEHASSLSAKTTFLLDAFLGMINIEQTAIIKTFSVAAVLFLPPTLIASIYGMNFDAMPELNWWFGYPLALLAMLASMLGTFLYFKRKGWI